MTAKKITKAKKPAKKLPGVSNRPSKVEKVAEGMAALKRNENVGGPAAAEAVNKAEVVQAQKSKHVTLKEKVEKGRKVFPTREAALENMRKPAVEAKKKEDAEHRAEDIVANPLVVIDPKDAKIPLSVEPISAVAIEGLMEYEVEGTHLRLLGMVDPSATPTLQQRVAIAKCLIEVGPRLPKYIKTIQARKPEFFNAEVEAKKQPVPAPASEKSKSTSPTSTIPNGVPLKKICADIDVDPKIARRVLRSQGTKPGGRWEWPADQVEKIKKTIKEGAAKLAAKE